MTIGADGCIGVPRSNSPHMDRIQGFIILILMAFLAKGIHLQGKITQGLSL